MGGMGAHSHSGAEVADEACVRGLPRGRGGVAALELFRCTQILQGGVASSHAVLRRGTYITCIQVTYV